MNTNQIVMTVVFVAMGAVLSAALTWLVSARRMPASHRVAIIGFPQTGKTTLITALFDYLFRHGARGGSVVPRGEETIRRINANLEQLELGRTIAPTTDQDVFAFRAEVVAPEGSLRRRYKLEIGDFPGESTVAFAEQYGAWLHDTPYFQWAMSADAFVFVADSSSALNESDAEPVPRQKSALRAAWQRLREHHLDGGGNLNLKTLLLVFTKADLLLLEPLPSLGGTREFGTRIESSHVELPNEKIVYAASNSVRTKYADLIEYFERESERFGLVFTSIFLTVDHERLGIPEIARRILPHASLLHFLAGARPRSDSAA